MNSAVDPFGDFSEFFADNPWIWAVLAVSFAVWVSSLILVVRSPKFRRKWQWALLTLLNFSFAWQIGEGTMMSLGLPMGALYVIGFWLWGPRPTAEALAAEAERRAAQPARAEIYGGRRLLVVRVAYLFATAAVLVLSALSASGALLNSFAALDGGPSLDTLLPKSFILLLRYGGAAFTLALAALWLWLAVRPQWWGKLLCVWAGLSWTMFGAVFCMIASLVAKPVDPAALVVLGCGLVMLTVAVVHQVVDPRLFGWSPSPR
ncbi:MAG: hypothetical protein JSR45_12040 [Proteobacteria bacterium]|nr:hypothetical protein [Pseudomonadota bacterium]